MDTLTSNIEADFFSDIVLPTEPSFGPEFARLLLTVQLSSAATERIRELLQRNNAGTITAEEKVALEKYIVVGQFLDLAKAKASASLQQSHPTSA